MKQSLNEILEKYGSDKACWAHCYSKNYELFFDQLREQELVLLEVGIGGEDKELGGASLKAWEEYFPNATIFGIDIYDKQLLNSGRILTIKGSQDDKELLEGLIKDIGNPDIIIDDASHFNKLTIATFKILFPLLKSGGYYVIEDLTCSYRWDFQGSLEMNNLETETIMNYLFKMLHELNPIEIANNQYQRNPEYKDIESMHFFPDMVIIKKL